MGTALVGRVQKPFVYVPPKDARDCAVCGASFQPRAARQKYCDAHAAKPRDVKPSRLPAKPCGTCGEEFVPKQNSQMFCSFTCKYDSAERNPYTDAGGYVRVWVGYDYPGNSRGRMKEHRYVMQEYLGRPLTRDETVHHLNGDRTDNRIENLEFRVGQHGKGATHHCPTCTCHHVVA